MPNSLVTINTYWSTYEADMDKLLLEQQGIRVLLNNRSTIVMDPFLANAVGGIQLQVPADVAAVATTLLANERQRRKNQLPSVRTALECLACGHPMLETEECCSKCGWSFVVAE